MIELIENIKVKLTKEIKSLYAIVTLELKGDWSIKGFRIRESNRENNYGEKLWITAPSYQSGGNQWKTVVYIPKEEWKKLEGLILKAYREKVKEEPSSYKANELNNTEVEVPF